MSQSPGTLDQTHGDEHEELAAGFAVGALDPSDEARFRALLAACDRCRRLAGEYGAVAATLPDALDEIDASPRLRRRILDAAASETRGAEPLPAGRPVPIERPIARPGRRAPLWALPLAALFAVTLGLGYWNYHLQQQLERQAAALQVQQQAVAAIAAGGRQWALAGTEAAPGAGGVLVQAPDDPRPFLLLAGLPDIGPDQAYQAWIIVNGVPTDAGVLEPGRGGTQAARLDRPLDNADTVALTVEPARGSRSPTGRIVVAGRLL